MLITASKKGRGAMPFISNHHFLRSSLTVMMALFLAVAALPCLGAAVDEMGETDEEMLIRREILAMFEEDLPGEPYDEYEGELSVAQGLDEAWVNILLLGTDDRTLNINGLTDSMIIFSFNANARQVKLTSIMRDTWVRIYGKGEQRINTANRFGGPALAMRTVNECFGMNISKYVLINMIGLSAMIDELEGVDVDITAEEQRYVNFYLSEYRDLLGTLPESERTDIEMAANLQSYGPQTHMTGAQATAFSRIRYIGTDYQRTVRQRMVLISMAQKIKDAGISKLPGMLPKLLACCSTNITTGEVLDLVIYGLHVDLKDESSIQQYRIPVDGTYASGVYGKEWSIRPDFEKNRALLREFIYGGAAE
jgi:LCP family protein required for cell wall assembly